MKLSFRSTLLNVLISFPVAMAAVLVDSHHDQDEQRKLVISGSIATKGANPYFVDLGGCGGTLIAPDWVLTAAHCQVKAKRIVMVGAYFANGNRMMPNPFLNTPDLSQCSLAFCATQICDKNNTVCNNDCQIQRTFTLLQQYQSDGGLETAGLPPDCMNGLNFFSSFDHDSGTFVRQDPYPDVAYCTSVKDHPEYRYEERLPNGGDNPPLFNDFSLCKLNRPVYRNSSNYKLKINAAPQFPFAGTKSTVVGFGATALTVQNRKPGVLQEGNVDIISDEVCSKILLNDPVSFCPPPTNTYPFNPLKGTGPSVICAANLADSSNPANTNGCQGDSGGPLFVREPNGDGKTFTDILVGVVSWGRRCGVGPEPGMYARVSSGIDWLHKTICNDDLDPASRARSEEFCSRKTWYIEEGRKARQLNPEMTENEFDQCPFTGNDDFNPFTEPPKVKKSKKTKGGK